MKRQLGLLVVVTCLAFGTGSLQADEIINTYGSPPPGYGGSSWAVMNGQWMARDFTPGQSFTLSQVSLALYWGAGDRAPINVDLRPDNGGAPSSTILESWVANTTADGFFSLPFVSLSNPQLNAGSLYWVVASSAGVSNDRGWAYVQPGVATALSVSYNQGSSWSSVAELQEVALRVEGTPIGVPEPGMLAMSAVVMAGIVGYVVRRRRVAGGN